MTLYNMVRMIFIGFVLLGLGLIAKYGDSEVFACTFLAVVALGWVLFEIRSYGKYILKELENNIEWISVLDKMPDKVPDAENDEDENCKLVLFNRSRPVLVSNNFTPGKKYGITHWMEVPKLPRSK